VPRGTPLVLVFVFNRDLTEGSIPKSLQSAWTNAKQKKVQGPIHKLGESVNTNHIFKPIF